MRELVKLFESGLCFGPRKYFYYLFVFVFLITAMMFMLNLTIFFSLGSSGNKVETNKFNLQMGKDEAKA